MTNRRSYVRNLAVLVGAAFAVLPPAAAHSDVPDLARAYTAADLNNFISAFGSVRSASNFRAEYDFNSDGRIDGADHSVLIYAIRNSNPNPPPQPQRTTLKGRRTSIVPPATPPDEAPPAGSDSPVPGTPPPGGAIVNASVDADLQLTLTDLITGRKIISPNGSYLWEPEEVSRKPALRPAVTVTNTGDGFNVTYKYNNTTGVRRSLGRMILGGIRFQQRIGTRDFLYDGKPDILDHQNRPYFDGGARYPDQLYSPCFILEDAPYTMGISVQYDVLSYKHFLFMRMESPGGRYQETGRNWSLRVAMNPEDRYAPEGEIAPGEQREYVMSVRILKERPDEWIRTLVPYRNFFRTLHGPVDYVRDSHPVRCFSVAQQTSITNENPYGYVTPYGGPNAANERPDRSGFGPMSQHWRSEMAAGWKRFMMWTPTGLYRNNVYNNYPFQFTSEWRQIPAIMNSLPVLKQFALDCPEFGLWWGRSNEVMRQWDTPSREIFDPLKSAHVAEAMEELAIPKQIGVDTIGLDTFCMTPSWKLVPWLDKMKREVPTAKFIIEPRTSDLMHNRAAMFIHGTQSPGNEHWELRNPHYLADFLNPGHEIWAYVDQHHLRQQLGHAPSVQEMQAACARFAAMGYIALEHFGIYTPTDAMIATESWRTSIPADLQIPAP